MGMPVHQLIGGELHPATGLRNVDEETLAQLPSHSDRCEGCPIIDRGQSSSVAMRHDLGSVGDEPLALLPDQLAPLDYRIGIIVGRLDRLLSLGKQFQHMVDRIEEIKCGGSLRLQ
jgi:hypothetical protein